jgi:hypothetical protein
LRAHVCLCSWLFLPTSTVPDTSGLTSVGDWLFLPHFSRFHAFLCIPMLMAVPSSLLSMFQIPAVLRAWGIISCIPMLVAVPPSLRSMFQIPAVLQAWGIVSCVPMLRAVPSLTSLDVPDTSSLESVGTYFMAYYAYNCSSLASLAVPDTSSLDSVGNYFMYRYAYNCSSLAKLVLPAVGWFEDNNVNWSVPSGRLGVLEGHVLDSDDLSGWKDLTTVRQNAPH